MQQHYLKYQQQQSRQQTTPSSPSPSSTPRSPARVSRDGQPPTLVPGHIAETTYSSSTSTVSPASSASFLSSSISSTPSPPPTPSTSQRHNEALLYCDSCQMAAPPLAQFDIVQYPVKDTLLIVSALLAQMVQKNDSRFNALTDPITLFHSRAVPRISIEAYLARILQFIPFTNEVLLNVLVYLDRIGGLDGMELIENDTLYSQLSFPCSNSATSSTSSPFISSTPATKTIVASSHHSSSISGSTPTFVPPAIDRRVQPPCCYTCAVPLSLPIPTSTCTSTTSSSSYSSSSQSHINNNSNNSNNNNNNNNNSTTIIHSSTLIPSSTASPSCTSKSSSFSCAVAASTWTSTPSFPSSSLPRLGHDSLASSANKPNNNHHHHHNNNNNNNSDTIGPAIPKRGRETGNKDKESSHSVTSQQATTMIQPHSHPQHPQQLHNEGQDASCPPATKKPRLTIHPVHVAIPVHAPSGTVAVSTSAITAAVVAASSMSSSTAADPSSHPTPSSLPVTTLNGLRINSFNIHRLLITCLMVAAKFTSDLFYSNARYAKVGGLSLPELNQLELEFLFTTRFELNVKVDELQRVGNSLLRFKNQASRPVAQNPAPQLPQPQYQQPRVSTAAASATNAVVHSVTTEISTIASTTTAQPAKPGRFSIPSPTSPRNGPMSDRPHGSSSSSSSTPVALVATSRPVANRGQLLSPPEEKQPWTDDVQATEE